MPEVLPVLPQGETSTGEVTSRLGLREPAPTWSLQQSNHQPSKPRRLSRV